MVVVKRGVIVDRRRAERARTCTLAGEVASGAVAPSMPHELRTGARAAEAAQEASWTSSSSIGPLTPSSTSPALLSAPPAASNLTRAARLNAEGVMS